MQRSTKILLGLAVTLIVSLIILITFFGDLAKLLLILRFTFIQNIGISVLLGAVVFFLLSIVWRLHSKTLAITLGCIALGALFYVWGNETNPPHLAMPAFMQTYDPGGHLPDLPLTNVFKFFAAYDKFEQIADIGRDPNEVPPPITRTTPATVDIYLETQEVIAEVADDVYFNFWTYNKQIPGPMLRVRQGDKVNVTIHNSETSLHSHNIDLHAVTGPGGGATLSSVNPGETKSFTWKALQPGLYVYHCASMNVSTHNSHGQYGLILVEPEEGLPKVDKEFYLMQGELYTQGRTGKKGLAIFDSEALLDGIPNYVTFNGRIEKNGTPRMEVKVGDKVRIFVGNGGVNLISSFHAIGEIFDRVYFEGGIGSDPLKNVQTTTVLPGGSSIVEFTADVPGNIILVDHALSRMNKGAWAIIKVVGDPQPDIFAPLSGQESTVSNMANMPGMNH